MRRRRKVSPVRVPFGRAVIALAAIEVAAGVAAAQSVQIAPPPVAQAAPPRATIDGLPPGDSSASRANIDLLTGRPVVVTLETGDVFRGRLLGMGGGSISLRNQFAGEFDVPLDAVRRIEVWLAPDPPEASVPPLAASPVELALPPESVPMPPAAAQTETPSSTKPGPEPAPAPVATAAPKNFWQRGDYNLEGGLSGSQGNTERSSLRFGLVARWTAPDDVLSFESRYIYTRDRGRTTQDRLDLRARNEWLFEGKPWSIFAEGSGELDEFRDYDALVRGSAGVGYQFIKDDKTSLIGRLGFGASREIGSGDESIRPEGVLGADFSRRLTENQSFVINAEAFPSLEDLEQYRTRTRAYYEVRLSQTSNLNLRLGIEHRFDSSTDRKEQNDLDYAATIVIKF